MGLGETIGYTARLTQNNTGLYQNQINAAANQIHIALMGDPTLRLHPVAPVASLDGSAKSAGTTLAWTPSSDSGVVGYHVYRAASLTAPFARLTPEPVAGTSFADLSPTQTGVYMVRAVKLERTPSGSYYNASQGKFWAPADSAGQIIAMAANRPVRSENAESHTTTRSSRSASSGVGSAESTVLVR
jgi:hypothetical protein